MNGLHCLHKQACCSRAYLREPAPSQDIALLKRSVTLKSCCSLKVSIWNLEDFHTNVKLFSSSLASFQKMKFLVLLLFFGLVAVGNPALAPDVTGETR